MGVKLQSIESRHLHVHNLHARPSSTTYPSSAPPLSHFVRCLRPIQRALRQHSGKRAKQHYLSLRRRCSFSSDDAAKDKKTILERLYRLQLPDDVVAGGENDVSKPSLTTSVEDPWGLTVDGRFYQELPLFDVGWVRFPDQEEALHIFQPHYVHMFTHVMAGPRPWLLVHVHRPHWHEMLMARADRKRAKAKAQREQEGAEQAQQAAQASSAAEPDLAAVGVLVEVTCFEPGWDGPTSDGRLLLRTRALGRVRIGSVAQREPYWLARCRSWPITTGGPAGSAAPEAKDGSQEHEVLCATTSSPSGSEEEVQGYRGSPPAECSVSTAELSKLESQVWWAFVELRRLQAKLRVDRKLPESTPQLLAIAPDWAAQWLQSRSLLPELPPLPPSLATGQAAATTPQPPGSAHNAHGEAASIAVSSLPAARSAGSAGNGDEEAAAVPVSSPPIARSAGSAAGGDEEAVMAAVQQHCQRVAFTVASELLSLLEQPRRQALLQAPTAQHQLQSLMEELQQLKAYHAALLALESAKSDSM